MFRETDGYNNKSIQKVSLAYQGYQSIDESSIVLNQYTLAILICRRIYTNTDITTWLKVITNIVMSQDTDTNTCRNSTIKNWN